MAIIGIFRKDGEGYTGSIKTLSLQARITFEPNSKKTDNGPDFRVFQVTEDFTSEIGAAWQKSTREGAEYLSATIDDPSFAERINCRLVKTGSDQGHTLYWDRQRPRD